MSEGGDITSVCKKNFARLWSDCSGFVKAVAQDCGVLMSGNANDIVSNFLTAPRAPWQPLPNEQSAIAAAFEGKFVVAGMAESGHGHVIVVIGEHNPVHPGRAFGYWGRFHSAGRVNGHEFNVGALSLGYGSITAAWRASNLPKLKFACIVPSPMLLHANSPGQSYHL